MYSMGIHYVVARALCNNPEAFAERSNNSNSSDADFKRKRGIKDMVQYLVDCCVKDTEEEANNAFANGKTCLLS